MPLMEKKECQIKNMLGGGEEMEVMCCGHANRNPRTTGEHEVLYYFHSVFQQIFIEGSFCGRAKYGLIVMSSSLVSLYLVSENWFYSDIDIV